MQPALDQFRTNLSHVRNLGAIYRVLRVQTTGVLDLSDLLRAELVLAVSAFDHYVHETTRLGMLEIHAGQRTATAAFLRFPISMESMRQSMNTPISQAWLENEIRARHGWQSFQQPDKVADAIRLVSEIRLWDQVAARLGGNPQDIKQRLNLIIDRRNKIAHEADSNPTVPGGRWPIDEALVNGAIDFLEQIASAIHMCL